MKEEVAIELLGSIATYPINLLKTNKQLGVPFKLTPKTALKGIKYELASELVGACVFHGIYNNLSHLHPVARSVVSASIMLPILQPVTIIKKHKQIGRVFRPTFKNVYGNIGVSFLNVVPGIVLNYSLLEGIRDYTGPLSGLVSTGISVTAMHPIDTWVNGRLTRRRTKPLAFKGLKLRLGEKLISRGVKMIGIDHVKKRRLREAT